MSDTFTWRTQKRFARHDGKKMRTTFDTVIMQRVTSPWGRGCIKQLKVIKHQRGFDSRSKAQTWARHYCNAHNAQVASLEK